ncbi:RidA family protein [Virgibacillus sp. W0430]|uniref:RidA family protein n=1 Tax=Virgibacillus sp. W0430 TaxID=3391580 RepID=UPI003F4571B7
MNCKVERKLQELKIELPGERKALASYVPAVKSGNLLFLSGQDCSVNGEFIYKGKVGQEYTLEEGQEAAKQCIINALAVIKKEAGGFQNVKRIVKMLAFVNSAPDFNEQPYVINGASDFLEEVFGDAGKHARSAIGTSNLPFDIPVEIELIVELRK